MTPKTVVDGISHGTVTGYKLLGCRCVECCRVATEYNRAGKAKRLSRPVPEGIHGKYTTYINWGCRCADCTEAHAAQMSRRRVRTQARAVEP